MRTPPWPHRRLARIRLLSWGVVCCQGPGYGVSVGGIARHGARMRESTFDRLVRDRGGMYYLVALSPTTTAPSAPPDHESFIDSLIRRRAVLLGGPFEEGRLPDVTAGYVLRCGSLHEARSIVARDPLVVSGVATAAIAHWDLVGINLAAIDVDLAIGRLRG